MSSCPIVDRGLTGWELVPKTLVPNNSCLPSIRYKGSCRPDITPEYIPKPFIICSPLAPAVQESPHSLTSTHNRKTHRCTWNLQSFTALIMVSKQVWKSRMFPSQASKLHHCYLASAAEGQAMSQLPSHRKGTGPLMEKISKGKGLVQPRRSHLSVGFLCTRACWEVAQPFPSQCHIVPI